MWTTKVCVVKPIINHPAWNKACSWMVFALKTCHIIKKVKISKMLLTGPMPTVNFNSPPTCHLTGFSNSSLSTLSHGIVNWAISYTKFWTNSWMDNIGKKGKKALATKIENTFPKFELKVILMYFIILVNTLRPSMTPLSRTFKLFSNKMIELASLVISAAVSTEIPTSAVRKAGASLMPSPIKPTVWPAAWMVSMIRDFCIGFNFANRLVFAAFSANSSSDRWSISVPNKYSSASIPTSRQTFCATIALSPVNTLTLMPWPCKEAIAVFAVSFAGSKKPIKPIMIMSCSSSTE